MLLQILEAAAAVRLCATGAIVTPFMTQQLYHMDEFDGTQSPG